MFAWVRKQKNKKGFTLLELIVVMAVLAILVAMGVPRFLGYTKDADVTAMKVDAGIIESACMQYQLANEEWPVGDEHTPGADLAAAVQGVVFHEIDGNAISQYIRSTKNDISDFVLVIDETSDYEGMVFHKTGVKDKDGNVHFGVND